MDDQAPPATKAGRRMLHLIGSIDPAMGGPVEAVTQIYRIFRAHGIEIEIATLDQPDAPFLKDYPFKVHALGRPRATERWASTKTPWVRYRYSGKYPKWLSKNLHRFAGVFVHDIWTYISAGARSPLARSGTPYFVFTHGALDPWFRRTYPIKHAIKQLFWLAYEARLLRDARHVLFTTDEEMIVSRNAFFPYQVRERVIRYGIGEPPPRTAAQDDAFAQAMPGLNGRPYLLYLSRIHPKKGCDLLIEAFAGIARERPEVDLVIAGPDETGWRPELLQLARREGIEARIHWPGMLRGDAKWGAFRGCEAFVLPSHQENFGIVVAEALACGKATLISNKVNIWREIERFGAGFVADDDMAGAQALLKAWAGQSVAARQAQAEAARACYLACFDLGRTSTDLLELVQEMVGGVDR